jgi:small-conductance mechanosensitive channel
MISILSGLADSTAGQAVNQTVEKSSNILSHIAHTLFNTRSLITLAVVLVLAFLLGRLAAAIIRRLTAVIGQQINKTQNLTVVTRLRRIETFLVLSIALLRIGFFVAALYFWWVFTHPGHTPTGILGAGALLALIASAMLTPVLRDMAYGAVMMAEHWYGVGDHITIDPYVKGQGVVERLTLRSTRIRDVSGEVIWVHNQSIWSVHVSPRGVRTVAIEFFVNNLEKTVKLVDDANTRIPVDPLMILAPMTIMKQKQTGEGTWEVTIIAEVVPGREWLLDNLALHIIKELNETAKVLVNEPFTRYTDTDAERRFGETIQNSRKARVQRHASIRRAAQASKEKRASAKQPPAKN